MVYVEVVTNIASCAQVKKAVPKPKVSKPSVPKPSVPKLKADVPSPKLLSSKAAQAVKPAQQVSF